MLRPREIRVKHPSGPRRCLRRSVILCRASPTWLALLVPFLLIVARGQTANAVAQVVGADVTLSTNYVWRGLTRASVPVLQPDLYLSMSGSGSYVTGGVWMSLETRSGASDVSDTGAGNGGLGEVNLWLEYSSTSRRADYAVGVTGYLFRDDPGVSRGSEYNTFELYGRAWWDLVVVIPRLAFWYDIVAVEGAYFETSVDVRLPVLPVASLYVGTLAGWSLGQAVNESDPTQLGYFKENGLTHVDLSTWASFWISRSIYLVPILHVQFNQDPFTRITNGSQTSDSVTVWFALTASWLRPLGSD